MQQPGANLFMTDTLTKPNSSPTTATFLLRMAVGVLAVNLFVVALIGYSLRESRSQHQGRAEISTQNLSLVLEQNIGATITKLDVALLDTIDEIKRQLASGGIRKQQLNAFMTRHSSSIPELDGLRMADAQGTIRYGAESADGTAINIADRDYFKRQRHSVDAGLIISRPLVSRVTGKWVLVISRRVDNPDGSFAGVAYGVLSLEHIYELFSSIDVGKNGSIILRDDELGTVARYPGSREGGGIIGKIIASDTLRRQIESGRRNGTYVAVYPGDGIERTSSFRKISSYPLYVSVGLALDDYLAEWRGEVRRMSLVAAIFFCITLLASWLIFRDWLRRKQAVQELARQELKFRTIADFTYDWEFWLAPDGSFIHTSPSCKRITGYAAADFYADPDLLNRIVHPEDLPNWLKHRPASDTDELPERMVFRIRHADGAIRWIEHVCQPVVDQFGTCLGRRGSNRDITLRKQAETDLREQLLFLQQLMDAIPLPVFYKGRDGLYLGCNAAFESFIGLCRDRIIGKSVYELAPKELADSYHDSDAELYARPGAQVYESRVLNADGTRRDVIFNKATYVDAHGQTAGIVGTITDVSQRKRDEESLQRSNRMLGTLTRCNETLVRAENENDLLHALCRVITEDGGYLLAWIGLAENDQEKTVRPVAQAGFEDGYLDGLGLTWSDSDLGRGPAGTAIRTGAPSLMRDIASDPRFAPWRDRALQRGYRSMLSIPLVSAETTLGCLSIYASEPDGFDHGELELMARLADDLTYGIVALRTREQRKQTAEALWESLEQYRTLAAERGRERSLLRALIDAIPDLIFFKNPDGIYLGCNRAFEDFVGRTEKDLTGQSDLTLFPHEVGEFFQEMDRQMMVRRTARRNEEWVDYPDGRRVLLETLKTPFYDQEGRLLGLIGVSRDITEREQANEERKKLEAQLLQAQKMEAIGQLAGGIAHDFNNILTAIIGYTQILLIRMAKESQLRHYVEQVFTSAERAADLTKDLLAFSRKQVLQTEPLDACDILRRLRKMLERLIPEDIEFQTTLAENELAVMADRGKLEQVILNLVTNARDAMPTGGMLSIDISQVVMDERFVHSHGFGEPGAYACISVTDSGHGMDEETRRKLFEPFFTTKEVGKGTGLGMAIIYGVVKQHDGYISVYSEPGRGTTFRIYLPLIPGETTRISEAQDGDPIAGGTETILLVEDDVSVRELHKMILEAAGYGVIEAIDGQDALDRFMHKPEAVDILITDVIMPRIDGKRLYQEIEKVRPDMRVLFMSGYTRDIVIGRGILDHEWNFLAKPVRSSDLLRKVRHILDGRG